jgi:hypothetical protein
MTQPATHFSDDDLVLHFYGESADAGRVDAHLRECARCAAAYSAIANDLSALPDLPVPERHDRYGLMVFHAIRHRLPTASSPWWAGWERGFAAAAVVLVAIGAFQAGRVWSAQPGAPQPQPQAQTELVELRGEVRAMREMLALSLLREPLATDRLRGVSTTSALEQPGQPVIAALLDTLRHDPSANVRLAAIDALRRVSHDETVRRGVVMALSEAANPLVQVALIDFVADQQDTGGADVLRRLSNDTKVEQAVRAHAAQALARLKL